jgi:AraC-like DNA-binding protein
MGWFDKAPHVVYLTLVFPPMIVPLYYFYLKALIRPEHPTKAYLVALATLLPGALKLAEMSFQCLRTKCVTDRVNRLLQGEIVPVEPVDVFFPVVQTLYWAIFIYLAWRLIGRTECSLSEDDASGARHRMIWLKTLTAGICVVAGQAAVMFVIMMTTGKHLIAAEFALSLFRCLFIQSFVFAAILLPEAVSGSRVDIVTTQRRLSMDEHTADGYLNRLLEHMEREKPYRDETLRLADLADYLDIPAYVLSQVINYRLGVKYHDFVNRYRVEEAQALLRHEGNEQFTLVALAGEAGFNSKASFNRAFNKHAGMSPSRYRGLCKG